MVRNPRPQVKTSVHSHRDQAPRSERPRRGEALNVKPFGSSLDPPGPDRLPVGSLGAANEWMALGLAMILLLSAGVPAAGLAGPPPGSGPEPATAQARGHAAVEAFFHSQDPFIRQTVLPNIEKHRKSDCTLEFVDGTGAAI